MYIHKIALEIEFDPDKDAANVTKHGISLARAVDMAEAIAVSDERFAEARYRIYGLIDGVWHCAAVTRRGRSVRVISLRRAHVKEVKRHGE